ncbi:hypothetical protein ACX0HA_13505 [Flavobacterium hauense]
MKKFFLLLASMVLIAGCDDGDMAYKSFDFSNQPNPTSCPANTTDPTATSEIYYKINATEGLILTLVKGALINSPTQDEDGVDTPREIVLSGSNTLTYYDFVSKPTSLCMVSEVPAFNEKWTGQGTLSVSTYEILDTNNKLTGYTHSITIKNVSFSRDQETITVIDSDFGNVDKPLGFTFNFVPENGTDPMVKTCTETTLIYTMKDQQILSIDIPDQDFYFANETGTKTITIPNDSNDATVLFNVYNGTASTLNVCGKGSDVPSLPIQKWQLAQGSVIIKTNESGGIYTHNIYLKNALFIRTNSSDQFYLDDVVTVGADGYFFGTY